MRISPTFLFALLIGFSHQALSTGAYDSADRPTDGELRILRVTPKGDDVDAGQQVVFQFDRPVVPIGRMERDAASIPIKIEPQLKCDWRWLNTSALACQLKEADKMTMATHYDVTVSLGIKTEDGIGMKEKYIHSFTTSRPKVTYTRFVNWLSPGTPMIQVTFNQPVTKASVQKTLSIGDRDGNNAISIIAYPDNLPRKLPWWMMITNDEEQPSVDDQMTKSAAGETRRIWVVEPRKELSLDSEVSLNIVPGLKSSEGKEEGVEKRSVVNFDTYPEFNFLGIRCTISGERRSQVISPETLATLREDPSKAERCDPLGQVALVFSAPVLNSMVKNHVTFAPRLDGGRTDYDPWENTQDWSRLESPHRKGRDYEVWLPERLKAFEKYTVNVDVANLTDEFNRKLTNPVDVDFYTDHREPSLRLAHQFAVVEKGVDSDVPFYVTNLDNVNISYDKLGSVKDESGKSEKLAVPKAQDIAFAIPMELKNLIGDPSGILFGSVHPDPTPAGWYRDPTILAQVTPFQVHAKMGHFNSLVWVTDFAKGAAVTSAKISVLKGAYNNLVGLEDLHVNATTDQNGLANLPGLVELDPQLEVINHWGERGPTFFIKVEKNKDIAVMPLNNDFSVRDYGTYPSLRKERGHTTAWGTTAQGVYKVGDTIDFKIYVRDQSNQHWISPKKAGYELKVIDPQGKTVYEQKDIVLNEFGSFDASFKISDQAAVGWYQFRLTTTKLSIEKGETLDWQPMSVLVSDFTPAPFLVKTDLNGDKFKANDKVEVTSLATMHAGGPFANADIRLTARLNIKPFTTNNPVAKNFTFGGSNGKYLNNEQTNLLDVRSKVDDKGQYKNMFALPDTDIYYGSIVVESAVKDDRGKFVASSAQADYVGRNRFVGLRNTNWLYQKGKPATLETLVVDRTGELVAGADVSVVISHREYKASRVKGPGNAYLVNNIMDWVEESRCNVTTVKAPTPCEFTPKNPGYYQFVATVKDEEKREHISTINGWVTGSGNVVWDMSDDAALQIIPERNDYKIGDTARYLIKNPFPGAKALVTVERYGVLDSWVQTFDSSTPVVEFPIKPDYLPGYYLSVVVVSPRVDKPISQEKVDLGKPSYRMGYVSARVSDTYKVIKVDVKTDKDIYKPREMVKTSIHVSSVAGQATEPYEIAVAVVDESVLALNKSGSGYYDPYAGFNKLDSLDVYNYSLISRLIGRQKFEKKGANPGGDGGSAYSTLRNMFKFVSYWNPSIKPDANGNASVQFEVPDNLTGWRVLALAVTPSDRMGLGDVNFKVNRPTEIRPVMPNQVVEGDQFKAGFSVMNRTDKPRNLKIAVDVKGPLKEGSQTHFAYDLALAPYKRENVYLPLQTKGFGELLFTAKGGDLTDADAVEEKLTVNKRRSLETAATYGTTTANQVTESVKVPTGIYTDVGEISTVLSPTVIGNVDGAFNYVKDYPYLCWEQRLTKAVFAASYVELQAYIKKDVEWPNPKTDVETALSVASSYQAPNGGMTYWIASNEYVSPYLSAYTAIAFNWLRRSGYTIPSNVEDHLDDYLLNLLRHDEFPSFYSEGMSSTVRAVALAALSQNGKIDQSDVSRYESHVPEMDLFGKAHFLQAAIKTGGNDAAVTKTIDAILGTSSETGGKFQFNETIDDSYQHLLATPLRSNCAILSSMLVAQMQSSASKSIGDIPFKLVRSITQGRGNRDHWENTQENVFCLNALIDYMKIYEATDPAMKVSVSFDSKPMGETSFKAKADPMVTLSRPLTASDPGKSAKIKINREGAGRLYYAARISYDLREDNAAIINSGIEVHREYSVEREGKFILLNSPMDIKRGELVKVNLFVSVPTARYFVVVNDPVPGGLEPVNSDLATSSKVDADKGNFKAADGSWFFKFSDWSYYGRYFWSFYHKELRHDSARFYSDYLPAGNYNLSYTAQAIAEGTFTVMPTGAEEMYDPDVYGKGLPATLHVSE